MIPCYYAYTLIKNSHTGVPPSLYLSFPRQVLLSDVRSNWREIKTCYSDGGIVLERLKH
jgi:hypothetical protein